MARGGGGGSRSGGHSGGSRSGGSSRSHSSSGRSSFGGSSSFGGRSSFGGGPRPGGTRPGGPGPHYHNHYYGPGPRPARYYSGRRSVGGGCLSTVVAVFIIIVIIEVMFQTMMFRSLFGGCGATSCTCASSSLVNSTEKREKLDSSLFSYNNDWYEDELHWIDRGSTLINGMEYFYDKTGIQPYLCLVEYNEMFVSGSEWNWDVMEAYTNAKYDEIFGNDEGHLLFIYFACEDDSPGWMDGQWNYVCGRATETVMDENAKEIFESYFWYYYDDTSLDVDELFAKTFKSSAKEIMSGPISTRTVIIVVVAIVAAVVIIIILFKWWKARKAQKNKEQEDLERMLNTPLETFGSKAVDDLKDKYDSTNNTNS